MKGDYFVVKKAEYWRSHDEEQRQSGLRVKAYCERVGINFHTFSYWRQKFRNQRPVKVMAPFIRVVESQVQGPSPRGEVIARVSLSNGMDFDCLRWPEPRWLRELGGLS